MISARVAPLSRDIALLVSQTLSPKARSATVAKFARGVRDEAAKKNAQALGREVKYQTFVDGSEGASEDSVNPDRGTIVYKFDVVAGQILAWIEEMLEKNSPVLTGRYQRSHRLFADGSEVDFSNPPPAQEYVFLNMQSDYARKVEKWDAVYEGVVALASQRWGRVAKISFSRRAAVGGGAKAKHESDGRVPAIVVKAR